MTRTLIGVISTCVLTLLQATPAIAQAAVVTVPWALTLGVQETYDSNIDFTSQSGGELGTLLHAGINRDWMTRRGDVKVAGDANQSYYRQSTNLNQLAYSASASASYSISRRLSLSAGDSLTSSYAQDAKVLTDAGLVLPRIVTRINTASAQVSYDASRRTRVQFGITGQSVAFDSAELTDATGYTVRAILTRQLGRSQAAGVTWGETYSTGLSGDVQGLLGTWQSNLGKTLTLNAAAGVLPYSLPGQSGYQFAPGGSFGVNVHLRPGHTVGMQYERAVEQTYGFAGTHLAHRTGAVYAYVGRRRVTVDAGANYGLNTYPLDPSFRLEGWTANAGMSYILVKNLAIAGGYSLWVRRENRNPAVPTYRTSIMLSYRFAGRSRTPEVTTPASRGAAPSSMRAIRALERPTP